MCLLLSVEGSLSVPVPIAPTERTVRNGEEKGGEALTLPALLCQGFDFVHELVDVFELAIHRCESDIGDLIELRELLHHFFADSGALDFGFTHILNAFFDAIGDGFDGGGADRPFFTGFFETGENFRCGRTAPDGRLSSRPRAGFFDTFVRGIAAFAARGIRAVAG